VSEHKYQLAAAIVRAQVAEGTLPPGALAPSGAMLARMTGYSTLTCRRALRVLIADGTLVAGVSGNARPRVPATEHHGQTLADAKRALSKALSAHRRAAGLTQPQLADLVGMSVTTVGHAETGRTWQSRPFWELADKALSAGGELLRLHDSCRAAEISQHATEDEDTQGETEPAAADAEDSPSETGQAEPPVAVTVNVPQPVTSITITWAGGTATTVYPPAAQRADLPSLAHQR
jgi:GntR family transcriptional regulator / MocR family aminotransferase